MKLQSMISIIIPVYNTELFLRECLDSVINQTLRNIEIICVNDSSPDNSHMILEEYAKVDDRIVIVNRENGGRSAARNSGLDVANGEYILFLDSDDTYRNDTCKISLDAIQQSNADVVCFGTEIIGDSWDSDEWYYGIRYIDNTLLNDGILIDVNGSVCNKLFKHSLIKQYGIFFPDGFVYEDAAFYFKYMVCCKQAFFIKDKLLKYKRGHHTSIMTQTKQGTIKAIDHIYIAKDIYDFWLENKFIFSRKLLMTNLFVDFFNSALGYVPKDYKANVIIATNTLLHGMPEIILPLSQKVFGEKFNELAVEFKLDFSETSKLSESDNKLLAYKIIDSLMNLYYGFNNKSCLCQQKVSHFKKLKNHVVKYGLISTLRKMSQKTKTLIQRYI